MQIDKRLLDLTDPMVTENFNRVLSLSAVSAVTLTADASGKITGGTMTLEGGKEVPITVETAGS
jgi:hypothetical protein|nr:MAG TPA: hypothetical protein [Caudoviricetes sp.]